MSTANKPYSPDQNLERYLGRTWLYVFECYVLDCIGQLPPDRLEQARDQVQNMFGGGDQWRMVLREQFHLNPRMDDAIRDLWSRREENLRLDIRFQNAGQFAQMIVDQNFCHIS